MLSILDEDPDTAFQHESFKLAATREAHISRQVTQRLEDVELILRQSPSVDAGPWRRCETHQRSHKLE